MVDSFEIKRLGAARIQSPIHLGTEPGDLLADFTPDDSRVLADIDYKTLLGYWGSGEKPPSYELAGPRQHIFFDPSQLKVGIVTCGGLCPGLNNVIRGLVMTLFYGYGVPHIYGFRYGYEGLNPDYEHEVLSLSPERVKNIHTQGGTILGSSRGPQAAEVMVRRLEELGVGLLFTIGGDGTFRGAYTIFQEIERRGLPLGVVGIPKTIDNDIVLVDQTFGFETAVSRAREAIRAARAEASSAYLGVGLVKLMGRHSGFIAANAALASRDANLVLIPELPFDLEGDLGLYHYLEQRFQAKKSTVIVVAEGAGQEHLAASQGKDLSGNVKLQDIGLFLKKIITERFQKNYPLTLKYIDPSYMIRSAPADSNDSVFCGYLAQNAAHAGMSGRTGMAVGRSHGQFTHIPLVQLIQGRKQVDPESPLWLSVLESTGQPFYMTPNQPKNLARRSFSS